MGDAEFNTLAFEKKLFQLKDTQESIQSLSAWCLKQRVHHKKIVATWLSVLKRVKVEQRLTLFYLANDVIQYSKRKNYEFVESWGLNLQKATPLVRDEKVKHKILRIFKIWEQRSVYDDEFLSDLTGLLSAGAVKKNNDDDTIDFQPQQLVNKIRQCSTLEAETDLRLKYIHESHLDLSDADALCASLKDRRNKDDVEKELNEGAACVEKYTEALQKEIVVREQLLELLNSASQYYSTQQGEVKVVAYAYKTFGARVRALKRKLDELIPQLPNAAPSPPERDEDVPSPGPDEDLDLPAAGETSVDDMSYNIDKTFNTSLNVDGSLYNMGLSSFLGAENPLSLFNETSQGSIDNTGKKIEVINSRPNEKQDFNINDFLKNLIPGNDTNASDNNSVASVLISQKSQDTLPGLDLLSAESSSNPPPPTSFYGSITNTLQEETDHYGESNNQWNNASWSLPPSLVSPPLPVPTMVPPVVPSLSIDTTLTPVNPALVTPITPSHAPLTPTHQHHHPPLTAAHAPITPVHAPLTLTPITPTHSINPVHTTIPLDTPESPPPASVPLATPPVVPSTRMFARDLPPNDVDHRGLLPPPPPPPPPLLPNIILEDIDHRLLPSLNPPVPSTPPLLRNTTGHKDVDHRNLISLTHQVSEERLPRGIDQDYRVPPPVVNPSDIVESVDMELSEDEEQAITQMAYPSQMIQTPQQPYNPSVPNYNPEDPRRPNFNQNNKFLTGSNVRITNNGKNGKEKTTERTNLIRINSVPSAETAFEKQQENVELPPEPASAPPLFNNKPPDYPNTNQYQTENYPPNFPENSGNDFDSIERAVKMLDDSNSNDSAYEDDPRQRYEMVRNPSPPPPEQHWNQSDGDWMQTRGAYMNQMNPRFQRPWNPVMRNNFRPTGGYPQFWPRNGPRPPNRHWLGPRPARGHW